MYVCMYMPLFVCSRITIDSRGSIKTRSARVCMYVSAYVCVCEDDSKRMCVCVSEGEGTCMCELKPIDFNKVISIYYII